MLLGTQIFTPFDTKKYQWHLGNLVEVLAVSGNFDDENTKINLMQLGITMNQMEQAINEDDITELEKLKKSLQEHIS